MEQQSVVILLVLVCTVFIGHVHAKCDFTSSDHVIYVSVSEEVLVSGDYLTEPPPHLNDINKPCTNDDAAPDIPCCVSDDNNEYIFLSLDDVFGLIQEGYFNSSSKDSVGFVIAFIGGGPDSMLIVHESHTLTNISSLTLQSFNGTQISCEDNVTIHLSSICSVTVREVSLVNCGSLSEAGLSLSNVQSFNVDNVVVESSASSGIRITLSAQPSVEYCNVDTYSIVVSNSMFVRNGAKLNTSRRQFTESAANGGGLDMVLFTSMVQVTITDTSFLNNTAAIGGGLAYTTTDMDASLTVSDCVFTNNLALVHGGAVHVSSTNVVFYNAIFSNNLAYYTAGGVYQFIHNGAMRIEYHSCLFYRNGAQGSSSLLITSSIISSPSLVLNEAIYITNSTFNEGQAELELFFGQNPCTVFSDNLNLNIQNSSFVNNLATAVCIRSAKITFSGNVIFEFNRGNEGGAINAIRSQLKIDSNANVTFSRNLAINGGGIFENGQFTVDDECLFEFPARNEPYNVTFSRNTAIVSGNSVYFYEPRENCLDDVQQLGLTPSEYSSKLSTVTFHEPISVDKDGVYFIDLVLGQLMLFNVTVLDYFNSTSFVQVNIRLEDSTAMNRKFHFGYEIPYQLQGFSHISLENGLNQRNISISGPAIINDTKNITYRLNVVGNIQHFATILVNLKPCPLGFIYNDTHQQCKCVESDNIACDYTTATSCISKGFWIGAFADSTRSYPSVAPCTSFFCNNNVGMCDNCPIADQDDYCQLPKASAEQCLTNRDGVLCSECIEEHALTFGGIKCVSDKTCDQGMGLIPAALNIIFLIFTIAVLIIILKFDYKLSSGYLYCFIFYFSIVRHLLSPVVVGDIVLLYISIPASFTQLNPQFLGYIPICFSEGLTALQQQVFLYLNPLIISTFVLLVVGVSRWFPKIKFADNTIVKAICLFILLSFTALTETSFNIINPVKFPEISGLVVNFQPSTKYLDVKEHLPYFLIATLVFLFLVIPFTLLLLFAPLLNKCFNLNKIKPFLDEFQGCYKDRFRWMAGYYFLARFIYILILTSPVYHPILTQYVIQLLAFFVLVVHMLIQPYQDAWLNFVDSLLLADLVLITMLFGSTADIVFKSVPEVRAAIVVVLVIIPIIYLVTLIAVTIGDKFGIGRKIKDRYTKLNNDTNERRDSFWVSFTKRRTSTNTDLREPLLDMVAEENDTFRPPSITISTFRPRFRSRPVSHSVVISSGDEGQPATPSSVINEDVESSTAN